MLSEIVLNNHLINLYSDVIFPSLLSKIVTPLISLLNFCLLKQQVQTLKGNNQQLDSRIDNNILNGSKQTSGHSVIFPKFPSKALTPLFS